MSHLYTTSIGRLQRFLINPRGIRHVLLSKLQLEITRLNCKIHPRPKFAFENTQLSYTQAQYNASTFNERSLEISLARHFISKFKNKTILEIGAVMQHYQEIKWPVVDKYEQEPNVIKVDILDFNSKVKFDLILCISTLEHIGQDEDITQPSKPIEALKHMQKLLKPNGLIAATIPFGYNYFLDHAVTSGLIPLSSLIFYRRVGWNNHWKESSFSEARSTKYGWPYNNANAISFLKINKQTQIYEPK